MGLGRTRPFGPNRLSERSCLSHHIFAEICKIAVSANRSPRVRRERTRVAAAHHEDLFGVLRHGGVDEPLEAIVAGIPVEGVARVHAGGER